MSNSLPRAKVETKVTKVSEIELRSVEVNSIAMTQRPATLEDVKAVLTQLGLAVVEAGKADVGDAEPFEPVSQNWINCIVEVPKLRARVAELSCELLREKDLRGAAMDTVESLRARVAELERELENESLYFARAEHEADHLEHDVVEARAHASRWKALAKRHRTGKRNLWNLYDLRTQQFDAARADAARLREVLRGIAAVNAICPMCRGWMHNHNCPFAAALKEGDK